MCLACSGTGICQQCNGEPTCPNCSGTKACSCLGSTSDVEKPKRPSGRGWAATFSEGEKG